MKLYKFFSIGCMLFLINITNVIAQESIGPTYRYSIGAKNLDIRPDSDGRNRYGDPEYVESYSFNYASDSWVSGYYFPNQPYHCYTTVLDNRFALSTNVSSGSPCTPRINMVSEAVVIGPDDNMEMSFDYTTSGSNGQIFLGSIFQTIQYSSGTDQRVVFFGERINGKVASAQVEISKVGLTATLRINGNVYAERQLDPTTTYSFTGPSIYVYRGATGLNNFVMSVETLND